MSDERSMRVDYRGRTVVITGASGAIGSAMAEAFAANGANVAIGCRNLGKGRELAERIRKAGGTAEVFSMEVTDRSTAPRIMGFVCRENGSTFCWAWMAHVRRFCRERSMSPSATVTDMAWRQEVP